MHHHNYEIQQEDIRKYPQRIEEMSGEIVGLKQEKDKVRE